MGCIALKLLPHLAISAAIGSAVWAVTGDALALPAAVGTGVLPDADHLIDYYNWYVRRDRTRVILLFHGWEYLTAGIAAYAAWWHAPWVLAAVLGYASQVIVDWASHDSTWLTYSVSWRAWHRFEAVETTTKDPAFAYVSFVESLPFGRNRLRRWFLSRLRP